MSLCLKMFNDFYAVYGILVITVICVNGDIPEDKIEGESLPSWNKPFPSKHYSGYIEVKTFFNSKYLHYW